jgi:hypothetical protein
MMQRVFGKPRAARAATRLATRGAGRGVLGALGKAAPWLALGTMAYGRISGLEQRCRNHGKRLEQFNY